MGERSDGWTEASARPRWISSHPLGICCSSHYWPGRPAVWLHWIQPQVGLAACHLVLSASLRHCAHQQAIIYSVDSPVWLIPPGGGRSARRSRPDGGLTLINSRNLEVTSQPASQPNGPPPVGLYRREARAATRLSGIGGGFASAVPLPPPLTNKLIPMWCYRTAGAPPVFRLHYIG